MFPLHQHIPSTTIYDQIHENYPKYTSHDTQSDSTPPNLFPNCVASPKGIRVFHVTPRIRLSEERSGLWTSRIGFGSLSRYKIELVRLRANYSETDLD